MRANRALLIFLVLAFAAAAGGCAGANRPGSGEAERDDWLACHGGTVEGPVAESARRSASALLASFPAMHLRVLDDAGCSAYSWPDGTVVVSRGLVEALAPDELAAAVAHELGHLIADGWLRTPAALSGPATSSRLDAERRADAIAVQVLKCCDVPPRSLPLALRKVLDADRALTLDQQRALSVRIDQLERPPGS